MTGGVLKYIELFKSGDDIYTAIEENILNKSSFLYDKPNFLLQREVSEVDSYFFIIKTIAEGNFILFSFAFIYPNLSFIESDHAEIVMKK